MKTNISSRQMERSDYTTRKRRKRKEAWERWTGGERNGRERVGGWRRRGRRDEVELSYTLG